MDDSGYFRIGQQRDNKFLGGKLNREILLNPSSERFKFIIQNHGRLFHSISPHFKQFLINRFVTDYLKEIDFFKFCKYDLLVKIRY